MKIIIVDIVTVTVFGVPHTRHTVPSIAFTQSISIADVDVPITNYDMKWKKVHTQDQIIEFNSN